MQRCNKLMAFKKYISKFAAGLLLLLFVISISPKQVLHDLFANHIDLVSNDHSGTPEISTWSFHCQCDNFVAESPFVMVEVSPLFPPTVVFAQKSGFLKASFCRTHPGHVSLRGPPALV